MRSPFLRRFRILFSLILLICFILAFSDFKDLIPSAYINILTWPQFIPSILNGRVISEKPIAPGSST